MLQLSDLTIKLSVTNHSEAMEADTILKNGRNLKKRISKENFLLFGILLFIYCFATTERALSQYIKVPSKEGDNVQLVFEDERKTFAVYFCWTVSTYIDKGQYADENNKKYRHVSEKDRIKVVNKNNKKLRVDVVSPKNPNIVTNILVEPNEEVYHKCGLYLGGINSVTGEMELAVYYKINFQFY